MIGQTPGSAAGATDAVLLKQYSPLVRRMARQIGAKLPACVEIDDLIQVGMMGLFDALGRFDPSQGVQFETFASRRIRGAMLDELRGSDWLSRGRRRELRGIDAAWQVLLQRLGRPPRDSELAVELGVSVYALRKTVAQAGAGQLVYAGAPAEAEADAAPNSPDVDANPATLLQQQRMRQALFAAIENLPEREQTMMSLYYEHDKTLKEIAAVLGVTESRVCQLHSQCVGRLRARLRDW